MKNNTIKFQSPIDFDALEAMPVSTLANQGLSDAQKNNARTNIEAASRTELNNSCSSVLSSTMSTVSNALTPQQLSIDTSYPILITTSRQTSILGNVSKQSGCYVLNNKLYSNSNEVATQTDINTVTEIAEGKTKAYITNKTNMSALNSSSDTVTISSFVDQNNTTVALSNFKVGDIVYLTDTEIPDRWVSTINTTTSNNVTTVTGLVLSKMETSKVDLNSYVLKTTTVAGVDLQDNITASELREGLGQTYGLSNLIKNVRVGGSVTLNGSSIITGGSNADTYFYLQVSKAVEQGKTYTLGFDVSGWPSGLTSSWSFGIQQQESSWNITIRGNGRVYSTGTAIATAGADSWIKLDDNRKPSQGLTLTFSNFTLVEGNCKAEYTPYIDIPTNKTAASGGTDLSLVTTGDKYNWNNKVSSTTITAIQVVSSMPASPDSNTLYIVQ